MNKHVVKHLPLPWLVGISILASTGVRSGQETCIASHLGSFGGSAVIVLCHRVFSSTFRVHPFKSQCSLQSTLWVGTFSPVPKKPPASAQLQCSLRRTYFLLGTVGSGGLILLVEILLISTGQKRKEEFRGLLMVSPDQYVPSWKNIKVLWLQLGHLKINWILCGFQDASLDYFPKQDVTFLKPWTNRIILSSFQGSISPSGQVCYLFSHRCSSCYDREKYFFCLYFVHKNGQASLDHSISFIVFFPHLSLVI